MTRHGFTILEVTLVLAVILIIAAIAVPSIEVMYGDVRLSAASDLVQARWAEARARAGDDGVPYRFAIAPETGKFRIEPDVGEDAAQPMEGDNLPFVLNDTLPGGVLFSPMDNGGEAGDDGMQTVVVFLPNGTANNDVEVVFRGSGPRSCVLRLRALTGAVKSEFVTGGNR